MNEKPLYPAGTKIKILPSADAGLLHDFMIKPDDVVLMEYNEEHAGAWVRLPTPRSHLESQEVWLYSHEYEVIVETPYTVDQWSID